jgi:hypothetical protein
MKPFLVATLLACSVGLNVVLLLGLAAPAAVAPLAGLLRPDSNAPGPAAASGSDRRTGTPASGPGAAAKWADLQSDDPAKLVANLRSAGFSDGEIRAILQTQLDAKVDARRRELAGPPQETPWWRFSLDSGRNELAANPRAITELREMNRQNARLLDSLLGPAPNFGLLVPFERRLYADLPPEKVDPLRQLLADYGELTNGVTNASLGTFFPEDRAKLKLIDAERDKDLRALLTPDEYDNFLLRSSNTASFMRSNLQLFQPTEAEFRRIFALQYAFDQQYSTQYGIDPDLARQRAVAQVELTAQIKASLSPERLADYERTTDGTYRQAVALVSRLELPPAAATQLWQLQRDTQQQMAAMRSNPGLTPESRLQSLAALQGQVTAQAGAILGGPRGLEAYKLNGGQWIQSLVPQVPAGR